ncbi:MAG: hypothetical protein O7F14_03325 [Alphaproteobacteria bacterium]|nr:hypothetical protein [Alphaproteobacteria bacterium]
MPITRSAGGIIADSAGIEMSFYLLGGVLLAMTLGPGPEHFLPTTGLEAVRGG